MVIHFNSTKERLDYLKGKHEEIIPTEVKAEEAKAEPKKVNKPKSKGKKKDDGKVQAK